MKKIILLIAFAACLCLWGCEQAPASEDAYYSFTDDLGYEVTLGQRPQRVAVLFSSYVEIWTLAGGETYITVGESVERGLASSDVLLVDDGAGKTVNIELLLAYGPDFVIASADIAAQVSCREALSIAGISVAYFRVETFEDYLDLLKICTDITGNGSAYKTYGEDVKAEIEKCLSAADPDGEIRILFIRAGSKIAKAKTAGEHFACDMLKVLGTYNIAENAPVLLDGLSVEEIIKEDPEFIFISTMGDEAAAVDNMESIFAQPSWQSLTAVKEKKYYYLPKEMFQYKPNHRWAEAYSYLTEILYGE